MPNQQNDQLPRLASFVRWSATWFGAGRLRPAPGTWGTLAAVPLAVLLAWVGPFAYLGFCVLLLPYAILASELYEQHKGEHDSSEIVIDEVLGYLITLALLPLTWQSFAFGFVLFRLLDIWKPLFIGLLDRRLNGGLGVVADDVAAGIVANVILQVFYYKTTWLGWQWSGGWS